MEISLDSSEDMTLPLLVGGTQLDCGVDIDTALIDTRDGRALAVSTGYSMVVDEGSSLGDAVSVEVVEPRIEEHQLAATQH